MGHWSLADGLLGVEFTAAAIGAYISSTGDEPSIGGGAGVESVVNDSNSFAARDKLSIAGGAGVCALGGIRAFTFADGGLGGVA